MPEKPEHEKFHTKWIKPIMPWFVLAVMVIVTFRVVSEFDYIAAMVGSFWAVIRPFFYGFLLAYLLNMPRSGIEKLLLRIKCENKFARFVRKRVRGLSVFFTYILFLLGLYEVVGTVVPYIVTTVGDFAVSLPQFYPQILELIDIVNEFFEDLDIVEFSIDPNLIVTYITDFVQTLTLESLRGPLDAVIGVGAAVFSGFLTFVSSLFGLLEKDKIKDFVTRLLRVILSKMAYTSFIGYSRRLNENFKQYVFVQTIDGLILGTIVTLQLRFIINTPYFLVLGIILAVFNYIPYLGSIVATLIAIVVVMLTQGIPAGIFAAVILIITQQIDGNIIQPKLMGGSFKISPLLIIISVIIGNYFAGILGMIVAIPLLALLKDILENIIVYYERKKGMKKV